MRKWRFSWIFLASTALAAQALAAEQPGASFHVKANELPKPFATPAVDNSSQTIPRPAGAMPQVPKGFEISVFASGLKHPRFMELAPDGDVFLSEPDGGKVTLLHGGKAYDFATGFNKPHGLAFHDGALYVADLIAVWKLDYKDGALKAGSRTRVTKDGFGPLGGHFSRDIAFDREGRLYLAIGSMSNIDEEAPPRRRQQGRCARPSVHLRQRHTQSRGPGLEARHRRPLHHGERARRLWRRAGAGLFRPYQPGRFLRLAL